jgi:hypothetical protein
VLRAVLGQLYGSLSKNKAIQRSSQAFRTLGFFWARQCGLIVKQTSSDLLGPDVPLAERYHEWKIWAAGEVQQRALLGLYMLDRLVAPMTGESTTQNHMSNQLPISCNDAAFLTEPSEDLLRCIQQLNDSLRTVASIARYFTPVVLPAGNFRPVPSFYSGSYSKGCSLSPLLTRKEFLAYPVSKRLPTPWLEYSMASIMLLHCLKVSEWSYF